MCLIPSTRTVQATHRSDLLGNRVVGRRSGPPRETRGRNLPNQEVLSAGFNPAFPGSSGDFARGGADLDQSSSCGNEQCDYGR